MEQDEIVWGYVRVSSKDQNIDRQVAEIEQYVTTKSHLVVDKASGRDFERKNYQSMKNLMTNGNTLVIKSLDRLGRNYEAIKEEWKYFENEGIRIRVLDMPILNTEKKDDLNQKLINDIVLQLLSYVAESELKNIKQRQKEGIAIAREKGTKFGRPSVNKPDNWDNIISMWKAGEITAKKAMELTNTKRTTFYKLIKEEEHHAS